MFLAPGIDTRLGRFPQGGQGTGLGLGFWAEIPEAPSSPLSYSSAKSVKCKLAKQGLCALGKPAHPVRGCPGGRALDRQRGAWSELKSWGWGCSISWVSCGDRRDFTFKMRLLFCPLNHLSYRVTQSPCLPTHLSGCLSAH